MRLFGVRRLVLGLAAALVLLGSFVYASQVQQVDAYEVLVDGHVVARVASADAVQQAVARLRAEAQRAMGREVVVLRPPALRPVRVPRDEPLAGVDELVALLRPRLAYGVQAVAVRVDGRDVVVLGSRQEAQQALNRILAAVRARIAESAQGRVELRQLAFEQRVELVPVVADPAAIRGVDAAVDILRRGTDAVRQHTVRSGETLWGIARSAGLTVEALLRANPQLANPHRLQVGDTLNLVVAEPYLTVRSVERQTRVLEIPYPTEVRRDPRLWPWERRVARQGVPGRREVVEDVVRRDGRVVARTLVATRTLAEPVAEVVLVGSRAVPGYGTGRFRWPMDTGRISSWFGWRGRDWHQGIDIAAPPGTPVRAADAGVVTLAGWYGAYGRTVIVDHGGGRSTLYGHLSRVAARVGERVERGEVIGYVGCTGRCTGPHLHFEIRIGGEAVNPLRFFR